MNAFLIASLGMAALNEVIQQYFLLKIIEIKIKQLKLKNAKVYFHENQIHLINSHEIYHLHFRKERLPAGETREPMTVCSANDYLKSIYSLLSKSKMELFATLVNQCELLSTAGKGSILNSDEDHRLFSKYVTVALFVLSCFNESKKMANKRQKTCLNEECPHH